MIYELLFVSDHLEKLITPDLDGSRHRNQLRRPNLSNCLPLLRTCQYVHEEAVSVLYGSNVFAFSDEPHGDDRLEMTGFDFSVQWCDFVTMYAFSSRIGRRNRARIRHLRLDFLSTVFIAYPAEVERDSRFSKPCGAANCIGDALELLSLNHNLHSFELVFGRKDSVAHREFHSMFGGQPRKLVQRMMQLKNVREVKDLPLGNSHLSDGRDDGPLIDRDLDLTLIDRQLDLTFFEGVQGVRVIFRTNAYDNFLALKREMESEEWDGCEAEKKAVTYIELTKLSWGKMPYGFRRNPIDQTKGAAERHDNQTLQHYTL